MHNVEVLVATINQKNHHLIDEMNIQTDAIISNQCDSCSFEELEYNGKHIKYLNIQDRGVGLNRNNALMRATGDYCIIADDDMVFYDGYEKVVRETFEKNMDADVLIFNIDEVEESTRRKNSSVKRVGLHNYLNYGAARIVFRRLSVIYKGITFNLNFGGGTNHSNGEDTLFLRECLRKGLRIYAVPLSLAKLVEKRASTWFNGYNEKYFFDCGIVLQLAHPFLCHIMVVYLSLRHKEYKIPGKKGVISTIMAYERGIRFASRKLWIEK